MQTDRAKETDRQTDRQRSSQTYILCFSNLETSQYINASIRFNETLPMCPSPWQYCCSLYHTKSGCSGNLTWSGFYSHSKSRGAHWTHRPEVRQSYVFTSGNCRLSLTHDVAYDPNHQISILSRPRVSLGSFTNTETMTVLTILLDTGYLWILCWILNETISEVKIPSLLNLRFLWM